MDHLDDNAASEFVSGSLPPSAVRKVEGHLAGCRDCRALVAALAAGSGDDSNAATFRHERGAASSAGELPRQMLSVGDRVGRYLVLSSLGAGGMGVVFAAYDPQLDRKIALKLLRSSLAVSSKDARTRLQREAQAIAQLSHPNVVAIYDVGTTDDGDLYIAMEFVEGDTLTTWLGKYPRTGREIIDVFVQAARGLFSAHGVGLLHRDFKPDNVLVGGDGRVRVTDFGLARSLLAPDEALQAKPTVTALDVALTATGTVLGTPRYMPPEQMTGPDIDARSDQFSFCVALYEALYGAHPLRDGTSIAMLDHGDRAKPPPEGSKIPAAIGRAVLRGLERDRARRFPSMAALIEELVPRQRRSGVRFGAVALAAVMLAGGTTAAVVVQQHRTQVPGGPDPTTMQALIDEKHRLEHERDELVARLDQLKAGQAKLVRLRDDLRRLHEETVALRGIDALEPAGPKWQAMGDEISRLMREVDELIARRDPEQAGQAEIAEQAEIARLSDVIRRKDEQIRGLTDTVTRLAAAVARPADAGKRPRPAPSRPLLVVEALGAAQGPVEGCFDEWAERNQGTRDEVAEATMVVGLSVAPDGVGTEPKILATPDTHPATPGGASGLSLLESCVSEQLVHVRYPAGPELLDLEATVLWSQGLVNLSPRVVGHHPAPRRQIELP